MSQPLRLGVAGLGTVGAGLLRLLRRTARGSRETVGRDIVVDRRCGPQRDKERGVSLDGMRVVRRPPTGSRPILPSTSSSS